MSKTRKFNVLIVEDDFEYILPLQDAINASGSFEIRETTNSSIAAFEYVKTYAPDVVILDLQLEEGDGFEFLMQIEKERDKLRRVPYIVVVTSFFSKQIMNKVRPLVGFIYKKNDHYTPDRIANHLEMMASEFGDRSVSHVKKIEDLLISSHITVDAKTQIRQKISRELSHFYMTPSHKGIEYLLEAVYLAVLTPMGQKLTMTGLYEKIADDLDADPKAIQEAIRRTVNDAFEKTHKDIVRKAWGTLPKARPTVKQFIVHVAMKIKKESVY